MTEIHIFSGLFSSIVPQFRKGTEDLTKRVNDLPGGGTAQHHIWVTWRLVAKRLVAKHKTGELDGPVILGGHSNGTLAARKIADALSKHGVIVDYEFSIDPTIFWFPKVNHNVERHDEIHATSGISAVFRWLTRGWSGKVHYVDDWKGERFFLRREVGHVAIPSHPDVHERIVEQIGETLDRGESEH